MRAALAAVACLLLAACPICPDGELTVVTGAPGDVVRPGAVVDLRASYGDWSVGPGACGGLWSVDGVVGGTAARGTIDACGRYTAPAAFPAGVTSVVVGASEYAEGTCADCCPSAARTLTVAP